MFWDILIIVGAVLIVVGVIVSTLLRKKKGITGCACCPHRENCPSCNRKANGSSDCHTQQKFGKTEEKRTKKE